ncbi:hypothetical protein MPTK2_7g07640 [Marchantia polymorpha subsp. ruderalis]
MWSIDFRLTSALSPCSSSPAHHNDSGLVDFGFESWSVKSLLKSVERISRFSPQHVLSIGNQGVFTDSEKHHLTSAGDSQESTKKRQCISRMKEVSPEVLEAPNLLPFFLSVHCTYSIRDSC